MDLFEMVNGYVMPSVHSLTIEPFRTIWEEDDTQNNTYSIELFTYVELLCSPKKSNPYSGEVDLEKRSRLVKKEVWDDENYPTDMDMVNCTIKYKELLSISSASYGLYVDAETAVDKLRTFFREFDLGERTPHGAMVLKPRDVTGALKDIDDVAKNIEMRKEKVHSELLTTTKTRNDREINEFER